MSEQSQADKLRAELGKVLDRITADPAYRQQLLDSPREALLAALGSDPSGESSEVAGYMAKPCLARSCGDTCEFTCGKRYPNTCGARSCNNSCGDSVVINAL